MDQAWHKQLKPCTKHLLKGFEGGALPFALVDLLQSQKHMLLVLVNDTKAAFKLKDQLQFFAAHLHCHVLLPFDILPYHGLSPQTKILTNNLKLLSLCLENKINILITTVEMALRRHLPVDLFLGGSFLISQNQILHLAQLSQKLIDIGYARETLVEERGQFALRGDILDIFPPHLNHPVRISFFGNEVESLKTFDPVTQRTLESLHQIQILPAREILLDAVLRSEDTETQNTDLLPWLNSDWRRDLKKKTDQKGLLKEKRNQIEEFVDHKIYFHGIESFLPLFYKKLSTLFDYLPNDVVLVDALDADFLQESQKHFDNLCAIQKDSEHIESIIQPHEILITPSELQNLCQSHTQLALHHHLRDTTNLPLEIHGQYASNINLRNAISSRISKIHNLAPLASEINQKRLEGFTCVLVCQNLSQKIRFEDLLARFDLPIKAIETENTKEFLQDLLQNKIDSRLICVLEGELHEGFLDSVKKIWWISDEEIFGKKAKRAYSKTTNSQVFSSFAELTEGDFLIHMDHGIGIYRGLTTLDFDVYKNDFLAIEYLGNDKLYVPVDKLSRVQRFVASEGAAPELDKLGGTSWTKTREKAKKAARKLAAELLKIQALRDSQISYAFSSHIEPMEEFAASFGFEETPDQWRAIEDVLQDMLSTKPMDRLICGDVGYGKTEVALRAAFLAVQEHKQVAILVPTTVLAFQHFKTCQERFQNYPVNVDLMSRFRSTSEQKVTLEKLKNGNVDIVIGTHRLLSQDVKFRDLGLLIVDEEHRFGVIHKEKIKKMKTLVDVMTLTATPIPRTLNFALNGIRDLSIINTPPVDRLAVKTFTCSFDPPTLRDALLKELKRNGQMYFVHNRVQSIERVAKRLSDLMPEARVRFGHGQMAEEQLEDLMIAFMNHEFDILVCTTIIESGLDIPNANTMFIDRADQLGLAQLYQLRGRVGRSDKQAYCYLLVPEEDLINTKAKRRLATIQRFTELGSGFKVASHDLEIRGAGNILGDEQSGHIAAIGYDMYLQLLNEAISELKNEHIPEDFEPEIKLNVTTKILDSYVPDKALRLTLYKNLSSAQTLSEIDEIRDDWLDRFGKLPIETEHLLKLMQVKVLAKDLLVAQLKETSGMILMNLHGNHKLDSSKLMALIQKQPNHYGITRDQQFVIKTPDKNPETKLNNLIEFLQSLASA